MIRHLRHIHPLTSVFFCVNDKHLLLEHVLSKFIEIPVNVGTSPLPGLKRISSVMHASRRKSQERLVLRDRQVPKIASRGPPESPDATIRVANVNRTMVL